MRYLNSIFDFLYEEIKFTTTHTKLIKDAAARRSPAVNTLLNAIFGDKERIIAHKEYTINDKMELFDRHLNDAKKELIEEVVQLAEKNGYYIYDLVNGVCISYQSIIDFIKANEIDVGDIEIPVKEIKVEIYDEEKKEAAVEQWKSEGLGKSAIKKKLNKWRKNPENIIDTKTAETIIYNKADKEKIINWAKKAAENLSKVKNGFESLQKETMYNAIYDHSSVKQARQYGEEELESTYFEAMHRKYNDIMSEIRVENEYYFVISHSPFDVAAMSTGQNWSSCMDLYTGCNKHYIYKPGGDVEEGTIVIFMYKTEDISNVEEEERKTKPIENSVSRILLKPFYNKDNKDDRVYTTELVQYGEAGAGKLLIDFARRQEKEINSMLGKEGRYYVFVDTLYDDSGKYGEMYLDHNGEHLSRETVNDMISKCSNDSKFFVNDYIEKYPEFVNKTETESDTGEEMTKFSSEEEKHVNKIVNFFMEISTQSTTNSPDILSNERVKSYIPDVLNSLYKLLVMKKDKNSEDFKKYIVTKYGAILICELYHRPEFDIDYEKLFKIDNAIFTNKAHKSFYEQHLYLGKKEEEKHGDVSHIVDSLIKKYNWDTPVRIQESRLYNKLVIESSKKNNVYERYKEDFARTFTIFNNLSDELRVMTNPRFRMITLTSVLSMAEHGILKRLISDNLIDLNELQKVDFSYKPSDYNVIYNEIFTVNEDFFLSNFIEFINSYSKRKDKRLSEITFKNGTVIKTTPDIIKIIEKKMNEDIKFFIENTNEDALMTFNKTSKISNVPVFNYYLKEKNFFSALKTLYEYMTTKPDELKAMKRFIDGKMYLNVKNIQNLRDSIYYLKIILQRLEQDENNIFDEINEKIKELIISENENFNDISALFHKKEIGEKIQDYYSDYIKLVHMKFKKGEFANINWIYFAINFFYESLREKSLFNDNIFEIKEITKIFLSNATIPGVTEFFSRLQDNYKKLYNIHNDKELLREYFQMCYQETFSLDRMTKQTLNKIFVSGKREHRFILDVFDYVNTNQDVFEKLSINVIYEILTSYPHKENRIVSNTEHVKNEILKDIDFRRNLYKLNDMTNYIENGDKLKTKITKHVFKKLNKVQRKNVDIKLATNISCELIKEYTIEDFENEIEKLIESDGKHYSYLLDALKVLIPSGFYTGMFKHDTLIYNYLLLLFTRANPKVVEIYDKYKEHKDLIEEATGVDVFNDMNSVDVHSELYVEFQKNIKPFFEGINSGNDLIDAKMLITILKNNLSREISKYILNEKFITNALPKISEILDHLFNDPSERTYYMNHAVYIFPWHVIKNKDKWMEMKNKKPHTLNIDILEWKDFIQRGMEMNSVVEFFEIMMYINKFPDRARARGFIHDKLLRNKEFLNNINQKALSYQLFDDDSIKRLKALPEQKLITMFEKMKKVEGLMEYEKNRIPRQGMEKLIDLIMQMSVNENDKIDYMYHVTYGMYGEPEHDKIYKLIKKHIDHMYHITDGYGKPEYNEIKDKNIGDRYANGLSEIYYDGVIFNSEDKKTSHTYIFGTRIDEAESIIIDKIKSGAFSYMITEIKKKEPDYFFLYDVIADLQEFMSYQPDYSIKAFVSEKLMSKVYKLYKLAIENADEWKSNTNIYEARDSLAFILNTEKHMLGKKSYIVRNNIEINI